MKVQIIIPFLIVLTIAGSIYAQENEVKETTFVKYRAWGRDPLVSRIIERKEIESTGGVVETAAITETGSQGGGSDVQPEIAIYTRKLNDHRNEAKKMIIVREYEKVIFHCDEGLKALSEIESQKDLKVYSPRKLESFKQEFERWKKAAQEGIIQLEALDDFKKRQITLQGIIWDEETPIVILDGNGFTEGDPYRGVLVDKIEKRRVNVVFKFKNREFYYTLEFPED